MNKSRVEIFSDGILAIIITIMVLEMKAPEDTRLDSLIPVYIPLYLLDESSSVVSGNRTGKYRRALGEYAPIVLAIADSLYYELDG